VSMSTPEPSPAPSTPPTSSNTATPPPSSTTETVLQVTGTGVAVVEKPGYVAAVAGGLLAGLVMV
jgi:hypothetical protein